MKKITLFLMVVLAYVGVSAQSTDLFFSEYIEGSGQNKALEIFNGTGADVDLNDYVIRGNNNGGEWNEVFSFPEGTILSDSSVYVIVHADADASMLAVGDSAVVNPYSGGTSYVVSFNGDDVRALCKVVGTDTTIIDQIGLYDQVDPGSGWEVAGIANGTKDHTLVRKTETIVGNSDFAAAAGTDSLSSEWIVYAKNDMSFLGWHAVPPMNGADILAFVIDMEIAPAIISDEFYTVSSTIEWDADITAITPEITVSAGATVSPASGVAQDFSAPVVYTVTAEDGTVQEWTVGVENLMAPAEVSIYDVQFTEDESGDSPLVGTMVKINGVVTGVQSRGFYMQDAKGAWNGVMVYHNGEDSTTVVGDEVTVEGFVKEYYNLTEVSFPSLSITKESADNTYEAEVVALDMVGEAYESVFVTVEDVFCAEEANDYGEWTIANETDTVTLDDELYAYTPVLGDVYESISGPLTYTYSQFKLLPRSDEDVVKVMAPKVSVTFNVDFAKAEISEGDVFYVTGAFTGWAEPGTDGSIMLTDEDADGIYTATTEIEENLGDIAYKYFQNAGWANGDTFVGPGDNGDRIMTIGTDDIVNDDAWGAVTSVEENSLTLVEMYPNPFSNQISLVGLDNVTEVVISNIVGQTVQTINVDAANMTVNTSDLESGIYVVTLVTENGLTRSERIVKK